MSFYERLIAAPDMQAIVKELAETTYWTDLESELVHGRTSAVVDEALKDNMVRTYQKVLSFLDPGSRRVLSTLLGRWDVFNIKTVLRGAHNQVPFEEVKESLLPAGYLSGTELEALAKLDDVKAICDTMAMWGLPYAVPLRRAFPEYAKSNNLSLLELALDRQYTEWASMRLGGEHSDLEAARRVLGIQVDIMNLVTVFRMIKEEVDNERAGQYFLEGGRAIRRDLYMDLTRMSDVDEVLDRLKATAYGTALDEAATRYLEMQSIPVFVRALEELLMRTALTAGIRDPHGVGVAIAYLWGKQNEVTNLRIIVQGKEVGMPADRVREELILV
jgi:V/A-type H+-transporting ATPase subunit C